jgi:hypothetical protein
MNKRFLWMTMLAIVVVATISSCASNRPGVGCPTTNKKYFRA